MNFDGATKPRPRLTPWWTSILEKIKQRGALQWLEISYALLNLHYDEQVEFEKKIKEMAVMILNGKAKNKHNWVVFSSANPKRNFIVAGFPYRNDISKEERNEVMQSILAEADSLGTKGAVVIAINIIKGHYPYSALGSKQSSLLFDVLFIV